MVSQSLLSLKSAHNNDWLRCDGRESFVQNPNITKNMQLVSDPELLKLFLMFFSACYFFSNDLIITYFI